MEKRFERKPCFDMQAKLSRDGRFWLLKRVETWILPRKYLDVIAFNHGREVAPPVAQAEAPKATKKGKRNADGDGQGS